MGFIGDLGGPDIMTGSNFSGSATTIMVIVGIVLVLVIAGIITFSYYSKKRNKSLFQYRINIFKDINGSPQPIQDDKAMEVYVQDSNVSLFYLKARKIYIAKPTLSMGKEGNGFWYNILPNGEWVNFDMKSDSKSPTFAGANYDHRDTRYAYINLKEIIKRNYKDKSVKWWKEHSALITFIIVSVLFAIMIWVLLAKTGKMIGEIAPIAQNMKIAAQTMSDAAVNCQMVNSGVTAA